MSQIIYQTLSIVIAIINIVLILGMSLTLLIFTPMILMPLIIFVVGFSLAFKKNPKTGKVFVPGIVLNLVSLLFIPIGVMLAVESIGRGFGLFL